MKEGALFLEGDVRERVCLGGLAPNLFHKLSIGPYLLFDNILGDLEAIFKEAEILVTYS